MLAIARRHGFRPATGPQADNVATMLGLVAAGFGVTLVGWPTALVPRPGVTFVRLRDEQLELVAVRGEHSAAASEALIAIARDVLAALVPRA